MAGDIAKRKTASLLQESAKRIRIGTIPSFEDASKDGGQEYQVDEDENNHDDDHFRDESSVSDDDQYSMPETPLTPFSPSRQTAPSDLKFKCSFEGCRKTFSRRVRLESHLRASHNVIAERVFSCSYDGCEKAYFRQEALTIHVRSAHTKEKAYICHFLDCGKSFATNQRLNKHQDAHKDRDRYRCTAYPPCNQHFRKHQTLQRHIRTTHLDLVPFPCTYVDPVTGVECNAGFDGSAGLRKHEDRSHGPLRFWCDECSSELNDDGTPHQVGFTTKSELSKHVSNEHAQCIFCSFQFCSLKELEKHLDAKHNDSRHPLQKSGKEAQPRDPKAVTCTYPDCNKTFSKPYNLTVHIRTIHENLVFTCGQPSPNAPFKDAHVLLWDASNSCGREFSAKANLEDHIRTQHIGLPTAINANRTKQSGPWKQRIRKKPDALDVLTGVAYKERQIPCLVDDCSWLFVREYDLQKHLRTKHGISPDCMPLDDDLTAVKHENLVADMEWGFKSQEGDQFWIGADESIEGGDDWVSEQLEMRNLIDPDLLGL